MQKQALQMLISALLSMLTPALLMTFADMILDWVEDTVAKSPNKYDDLVILPLVKVVRNAFGISDDDNIKIDTEPLS